MQEIHAWFKVDQVTAQIRSSFSAYTHTLSLSVGTHYTHIVLICSQFSSFMARVLMMLHSRSLLFCSLRIAILRIMFSAFFNMVAF